jgi:hypothetical protein
MLEADAMTKRTLLVLAAIPLLNFASFALQCSIGQLQTGEDECFAVIVTTNAGVPVSDLQQQDFTVYDNDKAIPITSFRYVTEAEDRLPKASLTRVSGVQPTATVEKPGGFPRYEITFVAAKSRKVNAYHEVGIKVNRPDLVLKARQGYFAHPPEYQ